MSDMSVTYSGAGAQQREYVVKPDSDKKKEKNRYKNYFTSNLPHQIKEYNACYQESIQ